MLLGSPKRNLIGLGVVLGLCGLAWSAGFWFAPTKTKMVEKIVTKTVKDRNVKVDKTTTVVKATDKNGKPVTTITVIDKTKVDENTKTDSQTDRLKTVERTNPNWMLGGYYNPLQSDKARWGVHADRRILGGLWGGLYGFSDKNFGVGLTFQF
jgi:hypothetical protein